MGRFRSDDTGLRLGNLPIWAYFCNINSVFFSISVELVGFKRHVKQTTPAY